MPPTANATPEKTSKQKNVITEALLPNDVLIICFPLTFKSDEDRCPSLPKREIVGLKGMPFSALRLAIL